MSFLISVATIWALACITPGPSTLLAMRYALTAHRRVAIFAAFGTITGTFCWGLAGWLGITSSSRRFPSPIWRSKLPAGFISSISACAS